MSGTWDIRLLTASYKREGPQELPVIQLFGRTREDKSITVEYRGFEPYFYVVEPPQTLLAELKRDNEVSDIKPKKLFVEGKDEECFKITLKHPWKTPDLRSKCKNRGCNVLAADIPFAERFIYDLNLSSCVRVRGKQVEGNYTTDLVVEAEAFEECEPFRPRLKILSFDIENSIKDGRILTIGCVLRENGQMKKESLVGEEKQIIEGFMELIRGKDPDVITGYNIDGYDIPIFLQRAKKLRITELPFGRDFSAISSIGDRFWRAHGRIIADAWWNAKRELRPKQETLDAVAKMVLGEGKGEVEPSKIDEEWQRDRQKVIEYCLKDAELALRILEEVAALEKSMDLATVSKLPLDEVLNGRTSTLVDSILIRAADKMNIGVPLTRHAGGEESIEGGYVHSIQPGIYHWVCVLDFKAMYPSLIIKNNICFTTLAQDGEIVSSTGARFYSKEKRIGLVPQILEKLMKERDEIKRKMQQARNEKEREYYNGLQDAVKILMNAFYGLFASSFYRFTNPKIGASITAFARDNIKEIIRRLEEEGVTVIYGDTDSIFFESPYKNLEGAKSFGMDVAKRFSEDGVTLEFEKALESFFSHGKKKRYVGKAVWPREEMLVRGYEIRRTDAFDLQSEAQTTLFERILEDDIEGAIRTARDILTSVQQGKAPIEKLVISRTCKDYSFYENPDAQSNVQAAKKLEKMGYEFTPGMKVSWIVTNGKKTPQEVEPYISGRKFEAIPDWDYYARRIAHTLAYVTDVFGWDEKSLLRGSQQVTLFHENFKDEKGKEGKSEPLKTEKKLTLEDFM